MQETRFGQVVGYNARARRQRSFHPGLNIQALLQCVAGKQSRGHQHGGIRGVGAAGDRRDQYCAVFDFETRIAHFGRRAAGRLGIFLRALLSHFFNTASIDVFRVRERHSVLRAFRSRERRYNRRQIQFHHIGVVRLRRTVHAP